MRTPKNGPIIWESLIRTFQDILPDLVPAWPAGHEKHGLLELGADDAALAAQFQGLGFGVQGLRFRV